MDLLKEGIGIGIIPTDLTRKLTIGGITKAYPVYKVPLCYLYYNDQNDRIATWISRYRYEHNGDNINKDDIEAYNYIIEKYIVESNPESIKKTRNNINLVGQREPGVSLSDGRIIDGNRRFTCLRDIARKKDEVVYFETVILDRNINDSAKQIKMLELTIQHGEESKVDYSPIDRLVGLYSDVVDSQLLSIEEYAESINESVNNVKTNVEIAKLMVEFLEFINYPKQYYLARELKISGPIEELHKLIKKCSNKEDIEDLKICVFSNIIMQTEGDITRFIRNFKDILGTEYQRSFIGEQKAIARKVVSKIKNKDIDVNKPNEIVKNNEELNLELKKSVSTHLDKIRKDEIIIKPIQLVEKSSQFISEIDLNIINKMTENERNRLALRLSELEKYIAKIKEKLD